MLKLSKALPVEFYLNGKQTFNEAITPYIDQQCFHQKFKCSTDVRLRVSDAKIRTLFLKGMDNLGNEVLSLPFVRTQVNTPLIDEKFTTDLDGWAGGGYGISHKSETWSWSDGLAVSDVSQVGGTIKHTQVLSKAFPLSIGQHYLNIYYELEDSGTDEQTVTLQMFLINSGAVVRTINVDLFQGQSSSYQKQITNFPVEADIIYDTVGFGFIYSANSLTIGVRIGRIQIGDMMGNYYDVNFVGSDYSLCDTAVQLFIKSRQTFNPLTGFQQFVSGAGQPITFETLPGVVNLSAHGGGTDVAIVKSYALEFLPGDYTFNYALNSSNTDGSLLLQFYKNGSLVGSGTTSWSGFSGDLTGHIDVTLTDVPDIVYLTITNLSAGSTIIKLQSLENPIILNDEAKSDFIFITSIGIDLNTIKYKGNDNFASLLWFPEDQYMQLDVDSRFFHDRPKDTVKAINLNNSRVIGTASELKQQIALQLYAMPSYMHKKIELALMHSINGNVNINEVDVTMEDVYTKTDLGEWNPFSTAEVWLTDKTFIERNVI